MQHGCAFLLHACESWYLRALECLALAAAPHPTMHTHLPDFPYLQLTMILPRCYFAPGALESSSLWAALGRAVCLLVSLATATMQTLS